MEVYVRCKDHTVSKEIFELCYDAKYEMLVTTPKPDTSKLHTYYESEDYISHTDAKRSLFEKVYHIAKTYALRKKVNLITTLHQGKGTLLDIGAGTGDFLVTAKASGWKCYGAEPNAAARELAVQKGIEIKEDTAVYVDHHFDIITMWHVLEHVPNLEDQITALKRLLKPNGVLLIAVPNYKSYDAKYYAAYWAGYDVPRHLWHFSKQSIQKLFGTQEIVLEKIIPMKLDAFYVSLLSEKYKNGKMNVIKAFRRGWLSNYKAKRTNEYSSHIYVLKNRTR